MDISKNLRSARVRFPILLFFSLLLNQSSARTEITFNFPDAPEFFDQVGKNLNVVLSAQSSGTVMSLKEGDIGFLPIKDLVVGQNRISVLNVKLKFMSHLQAGHFKWKKEGWDLNFDKHRSPIPLEDPIKVIKGPDRYVIKDGHHDFFMALYLGATQVPVEVVEDPHSKNWLEFWGNLLNRTTRVLMLGNVTAEELTARPPQVLDVKDDPNRFLATLLAAKIQAKVKLSGKVKLGSDFKITGPSNAIYIKLNDDIAQIEFIVGDCLSRNGLHYNPSWSSDVPAAFVEYARAAILKDQASGQYPELNQILVLRSEDIASSLLNDRKRLKPILERHLSVLTLSCGDLF